jgi:hypothetical protein
MHFKGKESFKNSNFTLKSHSEGIKFYLILLKRELNKMGVAFASNVVNESTEVLTTVVTNTAQACNITQDQVQKNKACKITTPGNLNVNQSNTENSFISITCTQTNAVQNSISSSINETVQQVAKATQGALGIGVAGAADLTNLYTELATTIVNSFNQGCAGGQEQSQDNTICKASGANVYVNQTNQEFESATVNCVQNNSAVNNVKNRVVTALSQAASATVEGILGPLIFILILVTIIVIAIFLGPELLLTNPNFWKIALVLIVILILAYFIIAYFRKWYPFKQDNNPVNM